VYTSSHALHIAKGDGERDELHGFVLQDDRRNALRNLHQPVWLQGFDSRKNCGGSMNTDLHHKIVAGLEALKGRTFTASELSKTFEAQGFTKLQAGFACREVWMTKAVKWGGKDKTVGRVAA
jgi:hypothetical protein